MHDITMPQTVWLVHLCTNIGSQGLTPLCLQAANNSLSSDIDRQKFPTIKYMTQHSGRHEQRSS